MATSQREYLIRTLNQRWAAFPIMLITNLGAGTVTVMIADQRTDLEAPPQLERLAQAAGIFMAGGDQARLTFRLGRGLIREALQATYEGGAILGGESAGAAVLGATMIAFDRGGPTPRQGMAQFAPGLGFNQELGQVIFSAGRREGCRPAAECPA